MAATNTGITNALRRSPVEYYDITVTTTTVAATTFTAAVTFDKAFEAAPVVLNAYINSITYGHTALLGAVCSATALTVSVKSITAASTPDGDISVRVVVSGVLA